MTKCTAFEKGMVIHMKKTIGIVGGGAAGMMAAITAAKEGAQVTILERNDRVGKKILQTGNGKCNLGNRELSVECYHGGNPEWIASVLERFDNEDTIRFFQSIGLMVKEKNGYFYPVCEQAASVLDVLRYELQALGVEILYQCKITKIERLDSGRINVSDGERSRMFDAVVVTCGGKAAPATGSDGSGFKIAKKLGHTCIPSVPALVQLRCRETDLLKGIAGVRADSEIRILCGGEEICRERGELQLTDYGISGIPVFQLSRTVNYLLRDKRDVLAQIDFLPGLSQEAYEKIQAGRILLQENRTAEEFFTGMLHKKLTSALLKMVGIRLTTSMQEIPEEKIRNYYSLCRALKLHITESNPYENAQVSAGGLDVTEVDTTMESRLCPGVYFAGEILDVDGRCGGYNLQWAWSSGYIAGYHAAMDHLK